MDRKGLTEQISEIVEDIVKEENNTNDLEKKIQYYWIISEEVLKIISVVKNKIINSSDDYGEKHIIEFEQNYSGNLKDIEYLISSSEDSGINIYPHYSSMQHNYYKIRTAILDCKSIIASRKMEDIDKKLSRIEIKSNSIEEKFEGIGSTILSTVVSLTVVVTAITAIEKISAIYIPLYIFSMVLLCMTLIIFINNLFNKSDSNSRNAMKLYWIIFAIVIGILFGTLFYIVKNNIDIFSYKPTEAISLEN